METKNENAFLTLMKDKVLWVLLKPVMMLSEIVKSSREGKPTDKK
jgi:hypothetical protein